MTYEEEIAYVAGIFDGEGSTNALFTSRKSPQLHFSVAITQKDTQLLKWIQKRFGGNFQTFKDGTSRLTWNSSIANLFLLTVKPYLIVKDLNASELLNIWENRLDYELLTKLVASRKARLSNYKYADRPANSEATTPEKAVAYVAGIFDGEGATAAYRAGLSNSLRFQVNISQTDTRVLKWIQGRFGGNITIDKRGQSLLRWNSSNAYLFLLTVRPHLIVKALNTDEMIKIWESRSDRELSIKLIAARRTRLDAKKEKTLILKRLRMYLPV